MGEMKNLDLHISELAEQILESSEPFFWLQQVKTILHERVAAKVCRKSPAAKNELSRALDSSTSTHHCSYCGNPILPGNFHLVTMGSREGEFVQRRWCSSHFEKARFAKWD